MPNAAPGWTLAYKVREGMTERCPECDFPTSKFYRQLGDVEYRRQVCGVCMDETCDLAASDENQER